MGCLLEKPSKSSIHVKRDLYIKVNTSLCPTKLLKALLKEKALFPTKVPAGRPFFGNKGPKKIKQRFISTYLCYLCNKIRVYENGSSMQQAMGFSSIILDFIAQT